MSIMDNTLKIELYGELSTYRRQTDKLSEKKLKDVLDAYRNYHESHELTKTNKYIWQKQN